MTGKKSTHRPNIKQPKIWHGFDLPLEGKKGDISPVTLILGSL